MRRVDGVLGAAGWGIRLFELVTVRLAPFREGARTGEVVRVASKARFSLSTRVPGKHVAAAKIFCELAACKTLGKTAGLPARIQMSSTPRRRDTKEENVTKILITV